ncbi:hypothetical protein NG55_20315, partial [Acinetobacter gyllenbergii]
MQNKASYKSKQQNVEDQVTVGYGASASGSFSKSNINVYHASVSEQSGLFAGDGGYHVKAHQVDLKGGAIVSTASKDNNNLTANSLTFSDIKNQSQYDAKSVSLSGGTSSAKDGNAANPTNNENW